MRLRRMLPVGFAIVALLATATPASAATEVTCQLDVVVKVRPGISAVPKAVTFGGRGDLSTCVGGILSQPANPDRTGTIVVSGESPAETCATGAGTFEVKGKVPFDAHKTGTFSGSGNYTHQVAVVEAAGPATVGRAVEAGGFSTASTVHVHPETPEAHADGDCTVEPGVDKIHLIGTFTVSAV